MFHRVSLDPVFSFHIDFQNAHTLELISISCAGSNKDDNNGTFIQRLASGLGQCRFKVAVILSPLKQTRH